MFVKDTNEDAPRNLMEAIDLETGWRTEKARPMQGCDKILHRVFWSNLVSVHLYIARTVQIEYADIN